LSSFTDDIVVELPRIKGKAELERILKARLARQKGYRLEKTLRALARAIIVGSWTADWVDATTDEGQGDRIHRDARRQTCALGSDVQRVGCRRPAELALHLVDGNSYNDKMQVSMPPEGPTGKRNPPRKTRASSPNSLGFCEPPLTLAGARNQLHGQTLDKRSRRDPRPARVCAQRWFRREAALPFASASRPIHRGPHVICAHISAIGAVRCRCIPTETKSQRSDLLQFVPVSRPLFGRTVLQQGQGMSACRDTIRLAGGQLSGLHRRASPIRPLRGLKDRSLDHHGHKRGCFIGSCE